MRKLLGRSLVAVAATFFSWPTVIAAAPPSQGTTVAVISTLHQFHEKVPGYGFDTLREILEKLHPDVLAVELTAKDLDNRLSKSIKREYQRSVFPFLQEYPVTTIPLEPDEPQYSRLVQLMRTSERELEQTAPQKALAFSLYVDELYNYLFGKWISPCAVNSEETDALFEVKHRYQNALYGPKQREGWEGWNQHAFDQVIGIARANPGKRIVVLMGAEHGYWLRNHLRQVSDINLLRNCAFD